ncbi:MAG: hypothetical protein ACD_60C00025G0011 [uncultured bacterium]|nr:MAG: hypothetical protein ACD_60C00025G0011 [uncultured bacterium]
MVANIIDERLKTYTTMIIEDEEHARTRFINKGLGQIKKIM